MEYQILLVEDNLAIATAVKTALSQEDFNVIIATDGQKAIDLFKQHSIDLVLLDLLLPNIRGEDVLKYIRQKNNTPIIIISMKSSDIEKAINLGLGADDYLAKPFSMVELIARVKAVIRRSKMSESIKREGSFVVGSLTIDLDSYTVSKNNVFISLTTKEFELLKVFITFPDKVFSVEDLYRLVWHEDKPISKNVINVHIKNLREKIEDNPKKPNYIITHWGFGYKLNHKVDRL